MNSRKSRARSREAKPSLSKGFFTMQAALKRDAMLLIEKALRKTEKGLNILEKEIHRLNTEAKPSAQKRNRLSPLRRAKAQALKLKKIVKTRQRMKKTRRRAQHV